MQLLFSGELLDSCVNKIFEDEEGGRLDYKGTWRKIQACGFDIKYLKGLAAHIKLRESMLYHKLEAPENDKKFVGLKAILLAMIRQIVFTLNSLDGEFKEEGRTKKRGPGIHRYKEIAFVLKKKVFLLERKGGIEGWLICSENSADFESEKLLKSGQKEIEAKMEILMRHILLSEFIDGKEKKQYAVAFKILASEIFKNNPNKNIEEWIDIIS